MYRSWCCIYTSRDCSRPHPFVFLPGSQTGSSPGAESLGSRLPLRVHRVQKSGISPLLSPGNRTKAPGWQCPWPSISDASYALDFWASTRL